MSFISDILNPITQSSNAGMAPVLNNEQVDKGYTGFQNQLAHQKQFLDAVQGYYDPGQQNNIMQQQQALANQLQDAANGGGPNPAQVMLNNATGQNVQNQAALMGSQRNAGANTALLARQAGNQGAAIQQNAAGQAAQMSAQQQIAARQQLMQQQGAMQQNAAQQTQGLMSGMFNQGQQQLANQQGLMGSQISQNQIRAGINAGNAQRQAQLTGGLINAGGQAAAAMLSNGGEVPGKAPMPGDHPANDVIDAKLSPGEIVIPRSILNGKDPHKAAADFVAAVLKKSPESKSNYDEGGEVAPPPLTYDQMIANAVNPLSQSNYTNEPKTQLPNSPLMPQEQKQQEVPPQNIQLPQAQQQQQSAVQPIDFTSQMNKAIGMQTSGIQGQANAQAGLSQEKEAAARQQQTDMKALMDKTNAEFADIAKGRAAAMTAYKDGSIDAKRYVNNMSGGERVGTAIGLLLSGIGSGLSGQPNMAMDYLNKQIDRDIEAQKQNMNKQQNLIHAFDQQYGNVKDAALAAKIFYTDMYSHKIEEAAAKAGTPMAKAQAQMAIGQLQQQVAPMQAQLAQRQAVFKGLQQGQVAPAQAVNILVPEHQQAKAFEEVKEYEHAKKQANNINKAMDDIFKLESISQRVGSPFQSSSKIDSLKTQILTATKEAFGGLSDNEIKIMEKNIPNIRDDQKSLQVKKQVLQKMFNSKISTPTLNGNFIKLPPLFGADANVQLNDKVR